MIARAPIPRRSLSCSLVQASEKFTRSCSPRRRRPADVASCCASRRRGDANHDAVGQMVTWRRSRRRPTPRCARLNSVDPRVFAAGGAPVKPISLPDARTRSQLSLFGGARVVGLRNRHGAGPLHAAVIRAGRWRRGARSAPRIRWSAGSGNRRSGSDHERRSMTRPTRPMAASAAVGRAQEAHRSTRRSPRASRRAAGCRSRRSGSHRLTNRLGKVREHRVAEPALQPRAGSTLP